MRPSSSVKTIEAIIVSRLDLERQVSTTVQRRYGILYMGLAKLSHQLSFEIKKIMIGGLVHPYIRYCITVWGGCSKAQRHRIQKALNFAARIVTWTKRAQHTYVHIYPTLETLG